LIPIGGVSPASKAADIIAALSVGKYVQRITATA
jgi:hypothetical protein